MSPLSLNGRYDGFDARAVPGRRFDDDASLHLLGPLAHADQAVVAVEVGRRAGGVEAAAVVAHLQPGVFVVVGDLDADARGAAVLHGVVHRFLADVQQLLLDHRRAAVRRALDDEVELHRFAVDRAFTGFLQRPRQIRAGQARRAQVPDRLPRLADVFLDLLADFQHAAAGERRLGAVERVRQIVHLQRQARQPLQQRVVNRPAHANALGEHQRELPAHALDPQPPQRRHEERQRRRHRQVEPPVW